MNRLDRCGADRIDGVIEDPSVPLFRRLAQSSPWRWNTVELEFVPSRHTDPVHAWIRRPGSLRVEKADGQVDELVFSATPFAGTAMVYSDGRARQPEARWASDTAPTYDADGLVSALPSEAESWLVDWDDPFYENYQWIAMLNPIEIARSPHDHSSTTTRTEVSSVQLVQHHDRPAWQAIVRTTPEYDPRCECCALLSGHWDENVRQWVPGPSDIVRLDLQTGICVFVGSSNGLPTGHSELDVTIVAVDAPMEDSLFLQRNR